MRRLIRRATGCALIVAVVCAAPHAAIAQGSPVLDTLRVLVSSRTNSPTVSGQRTVDVITREDLARRAGRTLGDILATSLGVDIYPRSPAQADIAIRGSSIEQVLILVDGMRVSDLQAGHFDLDLAVPTDMIERIEILRGTGSTMYGPTAIGGVVNIVTRRDRTLSLSRLSAGSFDTRGVGLVDDDTVGRAGVQAGGEYDRSAGHRPGTDYRIVQGRVAGDAPIDRGHLYADAAVGVRDFGASEFYAPYDSYETTHTSTASVRYEAPPSDRVRLDVDASARRHIDLFTLERDDPAFYQNHHDNWQTRGETTLRVAATSSVALAFGTEAADERLVSARLGDHDETRTAAFGEATLGTIRTGSLDLGLRGDRSSQFGDFASPSIAGSLPLGNQVQLRASAGRGFRAPTWTERFYVDPANIGSPDLKPERFTAEEIGLRARPSTATHLDVALFERQATDLIDWARPAGALPSVPWQTMNIESARYRGVEVTAQALGIAGADWTVRGSGLSFTPEGADGFEGKYALRPITETVSTTVDVPLGGLDLIADVLHARRAGEDGYTRADARLACRVGAAHLTLDVLNIGNADYLDASGLPVAGRAVFVGLLWAAR